jgi:hypothetical protein
LTDPSQMSDSELLAHYAMPRLIKQESGGRAGVLGPQTRYGRAEGMTQMLPATAQATAQRIGVAWQPDLMRGTSPEAAAYQEQLGRAYLQEGIEKTGDLKGGLKYYHGGPDTKQWGPKTNGYADAISADLGMGAEPEPAGELASLSDEQLMAMYQESSAEPVVTVGIEGRPETQAASYKTPPKPAAALPRVPQRQAAANPTIAQDALSGFLSPFKTLADDTVSEFRRTKASALAGPPKSLGDAGRQAMSNLMAVPRLAGDVLGLTSAPIQAAVRPVARGLNRATAGLPMAAPANLLSRDRKPRMLNSPEERQTVLEGSLNTALSAARAAGPRPVAAPKAMDVEQLRATKTAAYDAAHQLGVAYDPQATLQLAGAIEKDLIGKRINPKVTPKAHAVMEDIADQLKSGSPVSLGQLDDMRQQIHRATGKGDDAEKFFGDRMREMIDGFADSAGPAEVISGSGPDGIAALKAAREANRRYRNVQEVTNRTESADLRASSTYAGGNHANATRQNLRPLIDPKSQQRLKGLNKDEARAIRRVVKGTAGQNTLRVAGKVLDPRGLLGAAVQTVMGIPSGGLSAASIPAGIAASELSNMATAKAVRDALKVLSLGGKSKAPPPVGAIPRIPVASPAGLTGLAELAALPARIPSERPRQKVGTSGRAKQRQR